MPGHFTHLVIFVEAIEAAVVLLGQGQVGLHILVARPAGVGATFLLLQPPVELLGKALGLYIGEGQEQTSAT
jgi:hypothetical protein